MLLFYCISVLPAFIPQCLTLHLTPHICVGKDRRELQSWGVRSKPPTVWKGSGTDIRKLALPTGVKCSVKVSRPSSPLPLSERQSKCSSGFSLRADPSHFVHGYKLLQTPTAGLFLGVNMSHELKALSENSTTFRKTVELLLLLFSNFQANPWEQKLGHILHVFSRYDCRTHPALMQQITLNKLI